MNLSWARLEVDLLDVEARNGVEVSDAIAFRTKLESRQYRGRPGRIALFEPGPDGSMASSLHWAWPV